MGKNNIFYRQKNHRDNSRITKKTFLILILTGFIFFLCVNLISAANWDNVKGNLIIDETTSRYGKIEIRNSILGIPFLQLGKVADIEVLENSDTCAINCYTEGKSTLYEKGTLIDSLRYNPKYDEIRNFKIYIGGDISTTTEYDYWYECSEKQTINGTKYQDCKTISTPTQVEVIEWIPYNNQELEIGTYNWRVEGNKINHDNTDWLGTFHGVEINEWINWTGARSKGLVFFTNMSTGTGTTVVDSSLQSGDGVFLGADGGIWTTGIYDNALYFRSDATGLNISGIYLGVITNNLTIEAWIKTNQTGGTYHTIIMDESNYVFTVNAGNIIAYGGIDNVVGGAVADNTWHHVAMVVNGENSTGCLFIDAGTPICGIFNSADAKATVYVGVGSGGSEQFNGIIDEIKIWNITRTGGEILSDLLQDTGREGALMTTLSIPANNNINLTIKNFIFNCSASTLNLGATIQNITLYSNFTGTWLANETVDVSGESATVTSAQFNKRLPLGSFTWNCLSWDNDESSFASSNRTVISDNIVVINETYLTSVISSSTHDFIITIDYDDDLFTNIIGELVYDGISTSSSKSGSGDNTFFTASKTIPLISGSASKEFYWNFTLTNSTGGISYAKSSSHSQTVDGITLTFCNATYNVPYINFTFEDELTGIVVNGTFEATFEYWVTNSSESEVANYSFQNITENANYSFCVSPNYTNIQVNMHSEYSGSEYADRTYYLRNATLTNITNNIILYQINNSKYTKFYITVLEGISPFSNAIIQINKYFVSEGIYKTIGIRETDDEGEFIEYLELDKNYRFVILKEEESYGVIEKTASCSAAPCELTLQVEGILTNIWEAFSNTYSANTYSNITWNPDTKITTYTFIDISGLANYFRFIVQGVSYNKTEGTTICNKYIYTTSGSLICNVSNYTGEFIAKGYISRSPEILDKVFAFFISDALDTLGLLGIFLNIAIIITVVLSTATISRGSPSAIVMMLGLTILLLKIGGLFPFSWYVVTPIELILIWLLMKSKA